MGTGWNYGDILDAVGESTPPDRLALIHGERHVTWRELVYRTNNLARALLHGGAECGDKIAFYLRNCPEYSEGIAAAFKARLTHVNVNYRYVARELVYLLDNSDATVCVFDAEFADHIREIRDHLPRVRQWVAVGGSVPDIGVASYEMLAASGDGRPLGIERSPDDLLFLYTGGTTGMPKGVMWRHRDLWCATGAGGNPRIGTPPSPELPSYLERLVGETPPVALPLPPIMHGTGLLATVNAMTHGGTTVTLTGRRFDPAEALQAVSDHRVTAVTIVGDAFARPLVETLETNPGRYDVSSLAIINSSGVMWTREIKERLLAHNDNLLLVDGFASSEAIGLGSSVTSRDQSVNVAEFRIGPNCRVFDEDLEEVVAPGVGMVGVSGHLPVGYYKDDEKTARTFPVVDGVRYSIPGDWVRVEPDGRLALLGRGSNCINTAGEKVFPEEVEEVLKQHPSVADALVVGLPDQRWGAAVTAVVQPTATSPFSESEVTSFCRVQLAGYKVPKHIFVKDDLGRLPNGKADYAAILRFAGRMRDGGEVT